MSHDCSLVVFPIELAESPSQCPDAALLLLFVTKSTSVVWNTFNLLYTFTVYDIPPFSPFSVNNFLADGQVPLAVGLYQLVAQSLASVGLLDILDTELGFLVYCTET